LGTYALSAGYYDAYYGSAQKVRTLVQRDFAAAFEQVDVLASPTAPTVAFRLGEKIDDPTAMYMNDIATIPANLAGVPGISLPSAWTRWAAPWRRCSRTPGADRCWRRLPSSQEAQPDDHHRHHPRRLRRGDRPLRPGARHRGARRARHRHQDVRRRAEHLRRRAEHRDHTHLPGAARLPAGGQRPGGGVRDPDRPRAELLDRRDLPLRAQAVLLPGPHQELPDLAV